MQTYYDKKYAKRIKSYITALANDLRFENCNEFITISFNKNDCNIDFKRKPILLDPQ